MVGQGGGEAFEGVGSFRGKLAADNDVIGIKVVLLKNRMGILREKTWYPSPQDGTGFNGVASIGVMSLKMIATSEGGYGNHDQYGRIERNPHPKRYTGCPLICLKKESF